MFNIQSKYLVVVLLGLLLLGSRSVFAEEVLYKNITAPELKRMMDSNPDVLVVHSLSRIEYKQQHIPNTINIPSDEMDTTDLLPKDKSLPIVFYCMGRHCKYSHKSAVSASHLGYEDVYRFPGGIPEWRKYDYPMVINKEIEAVKVHKLRPKTIAPKIAAEEVYVLDVRPFFWQGSNNYIKQSVNIPLLELDKFLDILPRNKPIVVMDGFMKQSVSAAKFLGSKGYDVMGVVRGGINQWEKLNLPVADRKDVLVLDINSGELILGGKLK